MTTEMKRRLFLKSSLAASTIGVAVGAGLLTPQAVLAAWKQEAFAAKEVNEALKALLGSDATENSDAIEVKAPDIAENGAVVPITVSTTIAGVKSIAVMAAANPVPLIADFQLGEGAQAYVSTRIKMGKTGDVIGVVRTADKTFVNRKNVKVTIGGCGG